MSDPFMSEIRLMSFQYAPRGWAHCNGQLLPINQNQALFSLLGTTFGGNGQTNFALPDYRGRVPMHVGSGFTLGQGGGAEAHTVSQAELPVHTHVLNASAAPATPGTQASGSMLGTAGAPLYKAPQQLVALNPQAVGNVGGSQPHANMQPFLTISFCIALQGIFPPRN
ncbi:MAG: tail fiber protein [Myxococcaceae bacterium]